MKKTFEVEFDVEEVVYVKTDEKQLPRLVQAHLVAKEYVRYQVALNETTTYFNGFELSRNKSFLSNSSQVGFNKTK